MIDFDLVGQEIAAGFISEQWHPSAPIRILNYTPRAQFAWRWNAATMACRGLIVDRENRIVSRPFPKFFSYDQLNGQVPAEPFDVFEKLDGSLGILYRVDGVPAVSSRGSFTSPQAERATYILRRKYSGVQFDERLTYLFEIIYPQNRIVVDYGKTEDLYLLAVIETATGIEQPLPDLGIPCVKQYDGFDDFQQLLRETGDNREGFVVRFRSGMRVKLKFDEYKRLHNLLTGMSSLSVWEVLRSGGDAAGLADRVPDEFFAWLKGVESELRGKFNARKSAIESQFRAVPVCLSRRDFAAHVCGMEDKAAMFALLDGKPIDDLVWRMVRPVGSSKFCCDAE